MAIQNSGKESVSSILVKDRYFIPDYQREYAWERDDQIEDFWTDLEYALKKEDKVHFFGQIVIHNNRTEKKKYIIDGQQRITTSVIFLAVLRDLFRELYKISEYQSASYKFEDIRTKYIGRWSEEENELRFTLGDNDKEFFKKYIQIGNTFPESITEDSHKRIKEAYFFFYKTLTNKLERIHDHKEKYNFLVEYYNVFLEGFEVIYVETDELNEAFIIFETLNARGKDLETSDLLKNHLFRTSGAMIDNVKQNWLKTVEYLDGIDVTKYLRHYWNSKYDFVREKDLYKRMRDFIKTPKKSEEFVANILEMSEVYKTLINPNEEFYFANNEINKSLNNLKIINAKSFYPIVLAMADAKFDENTIHSVIRQLETFIFRNNVVAKKTSNKYEVLFAEIARSISEKEIVNKEQVFNRLKNEMLTDELFENAFLNLEIKKSTVAKYILRSINDFSEPEIQVLEDNTKIHLEHIMPKNPEKWKVDDEAHQAYLNKLGNLTLLGNEYNTRLKNNTFDKKLETYSKSKISITNDLCNYDKWSPKEIEDRQYDLFKVALKRWPIIG